MMKKGKAILGVLAVAVALTSGITVFAGADCSNGAHSPKVLYNRVKKDQRKTGEHVIIQKGGKEAVCYIYTEYYELTYYCQSCGAYTYENQNVPNVHSLSH